jgi:APA family basic amino acid/polyamine antiporter
VLVWTGSYGAIVSRVIYTEWIFFGALALGTLRLRRQSHYRPAFRAFGFPILPVVFAVTCAAIVINQIASDPRNSLFGLGIVLAGLPVYFLWSSHDARRRLSQPLLPAEVHERAAVGREQREDHR